jgi:carboxymethylenebutenolidase
MDDYVNSLYPPAEKLGRRGFLATTSLTAGYTLAAGPVQAQTIVRTDTAGLTAGDVTIQTTTGAMPGYRAKPATGRNFPVVLVLQEVFGVHEWLRDVCRRFAKQGYLAVCPDYYFRQGKLEGLTDFQTQIAPIVSRKPDTELINDLDQSAAWAAGDGGDARRLAVTGFCRGGRNTLVYASRNANLKAAVPWYGTGLLQQTEFLTFKAMDAAADAKCPVLGLYAGDDPGFPPEQRDVLKAQLAKSGQRHDLVIYPNAQHGFLADYRPAYNAQAAADAWARCLNWLKSNGVGV